MSLAKLYTYYIGNPTLQAALPNLYFGYVPPSVGFTYGVISAISSIPEYVTLGSHVEAFHFQITLYDTSNANVSAVADTVAGQFDQVHLDPSTLICQRQNRLYQVEAINNVYTYSVILDYIWLYNA